MKAKVLANLKTIQQASAEIVASGYLSPEDDKAIRFLLHVLPELISRVEQRVPGIIERQEKLLEALKRSKLIIESEDTHYVGQSTREAAIECLTMINDAISKADGNP